VLELPSHPLTGTLTTKTIVCPSVRETEAVGVPVELMVPELAVTVCAPDALMATLKPDATDPPPLNPGSVMGPVALMSLPQSVGRTVYVPWVAAGMPLAMVAAPLDVVAAGQDVEIEVIVPLPPAGPIGIEAESAGSA
jgi:hypothetical protein